MTSGAEPRRQLLISKAWVQVALLVFLVGFFILGLLAYRTYQAKPPIPQKVMDPAGQVLYTGEDISDGQQVFLHNGWMEYGSVFGHGAYLGPDFTSDYLHRSALRVRDLNGGEESDAAATQTVEDFRRSSFDDETRTITVSSSQAAAFRSLEGHYSEFFSEPTSRNGLRPEAITDPEQLHDLTSFFAWTAWAAS